MLEAEVVVVGGGPAGSVVAGLLAREGVDVLLLEGTRFPRFHVGESLLAVSIPYLRFLGAGGIVAAGGFPVKWSALVIWGRTDRPYLLDMPAPGYAYQVDRATFDSLLLDHARRLGARVIEGCWVREVIVDDRGRVRGLRLRSAPSGAGVPVVRAGHVVDASGLHMLVARQLGLAVDDGRSRQIAVGARFLGAGRPAGGHKDALVTEPSRDGWMWFIPLSDELTSAGFVGDEEALRGSPRDLISDQLTTTIKLRALLRRARLVEGPRIVRYSNHLVTAPLWDRGYTLVGDAAFFVDPLLSTGVHSAFHAATLAASALTMVHSGQASEAELAAWYDWRIRMHARRVHDTIRLMYAAHPGQSDFWRRRRLQDIAPEDAQTMVASMGASRTAFFARLSARGLIELPEAFHPLLDGADRPPAVIPQVDPEAELMLAPGARMRNDWTPVRGGLRPSLRLDCVDGRGGEVEVAADSPAGRLLTRLPARIDEATRGLCADRDDRAALIRQLDQLSLAGLLQSRGMAR